MKKLNKLKVSIVVIIIVLAFTFSVFGRYIYNNIREAYLTAKEFYFTSNILTVNGSEYQYDNWDGENVYPIEFDLYTYINEETKLDYDLDYEVTCTTSDTEKIKCTINNRNGTNTFTGKVPASTNISKVVVYVSPLTPISQGESLKVQVSAKTSVPYQKTVSCEFTLKRATPQGISYTIEDRVGRDYAVLQLTNSHIAEKEVTLSFDPTELRIDSNDEIYINADNSKIVLEKLDLDDKNYVKQITFTIDGETTQYVNFYKVDRTQNYSYSAVGGNESSIGVT